MSAAPLLGIRVLEFAGLAPVPMCGMLLADFGASVVKVGRVGAPPAIAVDSLTRGKKSLLVDMKRPEGLAVVRSLAGRSDVLLDPYRPGVLEKLGLGPEEMLASNTRLVYARISGYGQTGPWANVAGHDINYVALSGLLSLIGRVGGKPYSPLNLVADFAGGGLLCAFGILAALIERNSSGLGQVVDASMTEGAAYVGSFVHLSQKGQLWANERGKNTLDGGNPIYDTYETKDGKYISVGALEPKFHKEFLTKLGVPFDDASVSASLFFSEAEQGKWRNTIAGRVRTKSRDEWMTIFEGTDGCVAPVLEPSEVGKHEQHVTRGSFRRRLEANSVSFEPMPAPLLSRTPAVASARPHDGQHSKEVLLDLGYSAEQVDRLEKDGIVACSSSSEQSKL